MAKKKSKPKAQQSSWSMKAAPWVLLFATWGLAVTHQGGTTQIMERAHLAEAPRQEITQEQAAQAETLREPPPSDLIQIRAEKAMAESDQKLAEQYYRVDAAQVKNEEIRKRYEAADEGVWGNVKSAVGLQ